MDKKNKALSNLEKMSKARSAPRLIIGVNTPVEFRKALDKANRGNVETGVLIRMERKKREAVNALAAESGLKVAEFLRVLIDAGLTLGLEGVKVFIDAANKADDLEAVFKKAKGDDDPEGKKSSESLSARLKRLTVDDPDAPEHEDDADDDKPKRKKKKKKTGGEE